MARDVDSVVGRLSDESERDQRTLDDCARESVGRLNETGGEVKK
jgi:hypothetical protein